MSWSLLGLHTNAHKAVSAVHAIHLLLAYLLERRRWTTALTDAILASMKIHWIRKVISIASVT
jgi:hypothetical protein